MRPCRSPGARTRIEALFTLGRKPELAPEQSLMDGINAGRKTIPFARFDKERTKQGLECLRSYRTEWDDKARAFKKTPEHNWASHGADAWRYLSLSWRAPMREPEEEKVATLRRPSRSSDDLLGAFFVADFQVLELGEVGKFLAGNAHRRAGLLQ